MRSNACATRCGGNSRRLIGSKRPRRARASTVSLTSVATIETGADAGSPSFASGARRDIGEHTLAQGLEYASVSVEARDGDRTAFIEGAPLRRIGRKATPVGHEIVKSELTDSAVEALAGLAAHLAEPTPPEIALRECPLEKGSTISLVNREYR